MTTYLIYNFMLSFKTFLAAVENTQTIDPRYTMHQDQGKTLHDPAPKQLGRYATLTADQLANMSPEQIRTAMPDLTPEEIDSKDEIGQQQIGRASCRERVEIS